MAVASGDRVTLPSQRTRTKGGGGFGRGRQLPRCLPLIKDEDRGTLDLAAAVSCGAASPSSRQRTGGHWVCLRRKAIVRPPPRQT